ncbi:helix-turn-helix domain-containing protein [Yokenella regensburgei]|uniref:helix-turn-helix domain-containing protein n=1 Tax=Yokenella regensburgei TaxID=158877 RepID=UPI003ED887E4
MYSDLYTLNEQVHTALSKIGKEITNHSERVEVIASPKKILRFKRHDDKLIYALTAGEVELCNVNNNIILANVNHQAVFGLSTMLSKRECHYIRTASDVKLSYLKLHDFMQLVEEKRLWKDVSLILTWYLEIYCFREELNSRTTNSYSIVKTYLEMLWEHNQESLDDVSIFTFILNRTSVSRSTLNKILKDLSDGGYIIVNRGKLVDLKPLPAGY